MTEYWKSQARKYCEFCKCWFADNNVSISFHENGKRHKESVQKHISKLTKKSAKDAKVQEKIDDEMRKMESAAMAAYLKDVQNNADLTSQSINQMLGRSTETNATFSIASHSSTSESKTAPKPPPLWQEVKNDDGSSYFWNTETNDTTWDPPDEYISLAQQEEQKLKQKKKEEKKKEILKKQQQEESVKEVKAYMAREQMKERAVKNDPPPERSTTRFGPEPRAVKPYGSWTPVVTKPVEKIDLQLPTVKKLPPPPIIMEPEEKVQFKEKRIQSLGGDDGPVEFKRRKVNNAKRNIRQKNDDE